MSNYIYNKLMDTGIKISKGTAKSYKILCPFHEETNPSCFVDKNSGLFFCFGCQTSGVFNKLYFRLTGKQLKQQDLKFEDVINKYNEEKEILKFNRLELNPLNNRSLRYLKTKRNLNINYTKNHFNICLCNEKKYEDFIVFPINNNKRFIGYELRKYKNFNDFKTIKLGRLSEAIFNYDNVKSKIAIIVEGIFDCLYLAQFNFPCISIFGNNLSDNQTAKIIDKFEKVILLLDGDVGGYLGSKEIKNKLSKYMDVVNIKMMYGLDPKNLDKRQLFTILNKYLEI